MASKTATGAASSVPAVVDLSEDAELHIDTGVGGLSSPEPVDPLSSLSALASTLDEYYDDVPAFLNSIIAPHLPASLPSGQSSTPPDLAPVERQLGELLTRLNLLSQDTSSALEQSIHDISRTVPRLTYDLQFMRESAVSLQSSLQLVQDRVARQHAGAVADAADGGVGAETDEARTHRALDKLAHLDKLKTRMESARDILAEAESWSTLESEITSFIADKKWTMAGERLEEASKSLVVFQSAEGEYESKRTLLVSLQNELETALSAALKDAIARVDTEACASFHDIFRMMDRGSEFQNYYFAARRTPIVEAWSKAILSDAGEQADGASETEDGDEAEPFASFLPRFYETMLATLTSERAQIPLVFPSDSASSILASFFETTLDDLSPSFHARLAGVAEHYSPAALPEVIHAFKATEEFGIAVQALMDKLSFNMQGGLLSGGSPHSPAASATAASSPAHSTSRLPRSPSASISVHPHRVSVSHRFSRSLSYHPETHSSPSQWEATLYEPFLDLQTSYPSLEKRYLGYLLKHDAGLLVERDSPSRTLSDRAGRVFSIGEEAIARCLALTHGYGAIGLIDALNEFVQKFLSNSTDLVQSARGAAKRSSAPDELDFEGLDYSTEDWGAFQLGLHMLEACRGIRDRLAAFEAQLYVALLDAAATINTPADPSSFARNDTTFGAITLLQQSTLNSAALHGLATSLTPPGVPLTRARDAVASYTRAAQVFLQSIILSPLKAQLETYPRLQVWGQPDKAPRRGELQIPSFSLSPTDTISRVSEGLLNLLRVFEVYAADDALAFSIETLPFVDVDSLRELLRPGKDKGEEMAALATQSPSGTPPPSVATGVVASTGNDAKGALSAEAVLSTWVSSLALSLLSHLTRSTLPDLRTLSTAGAAQLASDLAYLSNAVRALDVEWEDLERWREAAECKDEAAWREKAGDEVAKGVWANVGRLRGWSA